jgi:hypothetical protein
MYFTDDLADKHADYLVAKYGQELGMRVFDAVETWLNVWLDVRKATNDTMGPDMIVDVANIMSDVTNQMILTRKNKPVPDSLEDWMNG